MKIVSPLFLLLATANACDEQLRMFSRELGSDYECTCRNGLFNEFTTCTEICETCHLEYRVCTKKRIRYKTFTGFTIFDQGEISLVNYAATVDLTWGTSSNGELLNLFVEPGESCNGRSGSGDRCQSCSIGSNGCIRLDCSNLDRQGVYDCCSGDVTFGEMDLFGMYLETFPLECISIGSGVQKVCPGEPNPIHSKQSRQRPQCSRLLRDLSQPLLRDLSHPPRRVQSPENQRKGRRHPLHRSLVSSRMRRPIQQTLVFQRSFPWLHFFRQCYSLVVCSIGPRNTQ